MRSTRINSFMTQFGSEKAHHKILDGRPDDIHGLLKHADHPSIHARLVRHDNANYRSDYAAKTTNPEHIHQLAKDEDSWVRNQTAINAHASPEHLEHLIHDPEVSVRRTLAHNKNLTLDQASRMDHSDHSVGMSLAVRFPALHDKLMHHPEDSVRARVAHHYEVKPDHIRHLMHDPSAEVRAMAASNLSHRDITHPVLMHDKDYTVRRAVAEKANKEIATHLMKHDPDSTVNTAGYLRVMHLRDDDTSDRLPDLFKHESTERLNSFIQFTNENRTI